MAIFCYIYLTEEPSFLAMKAYKSDQIYEVINVLNSRLRSSDLVLMDHNRICGMSIDTRLDMLYIYWECEQIDGTVHEAGLSICTRNIEEIILNGSEIKIRGIFDCVYDRTLTLTHTMVFIGEVKKLRDFTQLEEAINEEVEELNKIEIAC